MDDEPHNHPYQRPKQAVGPAGLLAMALACPALLLTARGGGSPGGPHAAGSGSSPKTASSSSNGSGGSAIGAEVR